MILSGMTKGVNRKVTVGSAILLIPFLVWFGFNTADYGSKQDGTLYVGLEIPFYGIDVLGSAGVLNPEVTAMCNLVMERLFTAGPTGRPEPVLGLSADVSGDGKTWDITLRQGVRFHDTTPFNADAVVHHWKRILDPENRFRGRSFFEPIVDVKKTGEFTVRFILAHAWAPFLSVLSDESYLFAYIPSPTAVDALTHNEAPVGTGPFQFDKWNNGDHFSVRRNEHYWQEGKPFLERVVFRQIPDAQTRYAALVSLQVDAVAVDRGTIIQKADAEETLDVFPSAGNGAEIILLNLDRPPLDDIRVRRALALANNQQRHIRMVYQDTVPFVRHPYGEGVDCGTAAYLEYDPDAAKALIRDYGKPVEIECLHSNTLRGRNIGELLQQLYAPVGITLKPVAQHPGSQIMRVVNKDFQMATWRMLSSLDQGTALLRTFHSESKGNWTNTQFPELDRLLEAQQTEGDPYSRGELLCNIAEFINENVLVLYRSGRRFHVIANEKVRGIGLAGEMLDLSSAWIKGYKDNVWARRNEAAAKSPVDCSDPGDIETVRQQIIGQWKGKDNYGAILRAEFKADGTVTASRGDRGGTVKYTICGNTVFWRPPGALLVVSPEAGQIRGHWEYSGYTGKFSLNRVN